MKHKSLLGLLLIFYSLHANATGGVDARKYPLNNHSGFIENKGQIIDQNNNPNLTVKYLFNSNGLNVQLRKTGFSYDVFKVESKPKVRATDGRELLNDVKFGNKFPNDKIFDNTTYHFHRIDFEFENANTDINIISAGASEDYTNYYTPGTPEQGVNMVKAYQKVIYKNVWNGIDIEFLIVESKPKYNIILHPFAKLTDIKFRINGPDHISEKNGQLLLSNSINDVTESIPYSFYTTDGNKGTITTNFKKLEDNLFTITTNETIPANAILTIDPTPNLLWGTYYGGSGNELGGGSGIASDANGNIVMIGTTSSTAGIATSGAYQNMIGGNYDAFVVKLNPAGVRQWATYYGGSGIDEGNGIAIDASGNIAITGSTTSSAAIASVGAYQTTLGGVEDAFVVKFNSSGLEQWATYYGGTNDDKGYGIATDNSGNVFITGWTSSSTSMATSGAYQPDYGGAFDAFIVKFDSGGSNQWATYYGGSNNDYGNKIATDGAGNILITGYTFSTSGIVSNGAYQTTFGGSCDAFVAKFDSNGSFKWATYYGGLGNDQGKGIATDIGGNIYITGSTSSLSGIASTGAYQTTHGGSSDVFIAKFNSSGVLQWATYYGGSGDDYGYGIATDVNGNVLITGNTSSTSGIATTGVYQQTFGGYYDVFVVKFNSSGLRQWGTYYGGSSDDYGRAIVMGANGNIIITGYTTSTSGIATTGAYQTIIGGGGNQDAFIANFGECMLQLSPISVMSNANPFNCSGGWVDFSVNILGASPPIYATLVSPYYKWTGPNGLDTTTTVLHLLLNNLSIQNSGHYKVIVYDSVYGCKGSSYYDSLIVYPKPSTGFSQNSLSQCLRGNHFLLNDTSTILSGTITKRLWSFSSGDTSTSTIINKSFANAGVYSVRLIELSDRWCSDTLIKNISVYPQTNIGFTANNLSRCSTNTFLFTDTSTVAGGTHTDLWSLGDGTTSTTSIVNKPYITGGVYTVKLVTTTNRGCLDSVQKNIPVAAPYLQPYAGYNQNNFAQCLSGNNFTLNDTSNISSGTITRLWNLGDATSSNTIIVNKNFANPGNYTIKLLVTSDHNCKDSATKIFTVYPQTNIGFTVNHAVQCLQNRFLFTDTSTVKNGTYSKFWHLGDGSTSTLSVINKTYGVGLFIVKLNTTTDKGCVDSAQQNITVNLYPTPNVGYTQNNFAQCISGNKFLLNDTSTISSGTITGLWNFGDATASSISNVNKSFANAGTYQIKLIETSDHNCTDSLVKTFTVFPRPYAGYLLNDSAQCLSGNNFPLNDVSTISSGTITRLWDFGDATTSSNRNVIKSFANAGIYTVKLVEISDNNCRDSATKMFTVYPQTNIGFTVNNLNQCVSNNNYIFIDTSSVSSGTFSRNWNLGDGNISTAIVVNKSYKGNGSYQVKLNTITNNGCKDSVQRIVNVYSNPAAGFSLNDSIQCLIENNFLFKDSSIVPGGIYTRYWDLGDATVNNFATFSKSYHTIGNYQVVLKIVDANNCSDSAVHSVTVKQSPVKPHIFSLAKTQIQSTFSPTTYQWFLNSNPISNSNSQILHIHTSGNYFVKIDSSNGCSNSSDPVNMTLSDNGQLIIYPNPNKGLFSIDFLALQGAKQIEVFDLNGKLISLYLTSDDNIEIQLDPLPAAGMYILKIQSGAGTFNAKVVVVD